MARRLSPLGVLAAAALLASCGPRAANEAVKNAAADEPGPEVSILPAAEAPLDREALLMAVARAASAVASGTDDRDAQRGLDGDRFELRLRFGCPGSAEESAEDTRRWSFEEERRILRFRLGPDIAGDSAEVRRIAGAEFEAVEGFWIRTPWLLAAACPANPPRVPAAGQRAGKPVEAATPPQAPQPRIGIAQFFSEADARTRRRDKRAYEATSSLAAGEAPSAQGYNLVLSGRLKRLPSGRAIACAVERADSAPACIISAQFDRVWIERPDTRQALAEWGSG